MGPRHHYRPLPPETPADAANVLRYGRVASVDRAAGTCTVECGGLITGDIPWADGPQGGTRSWFPPTIGEQVALFAPEGELEAAFVMRGIPSDAHPPIGDPDRELLRFSDGTELAYNPSTKHLQISLAEGGSIAITGNVTITGSLTVTEDVTADGVSLKIHRHTGVTAGGAQSGQPA